MEMLTAGKRMRRELVEAAAWLLGIVFLACSCGRNDVPEISAEPSFPVADVQASDSVLAERLARLVARTPRIDSAKLAVAVTNLTTGQEVYAHHADRWMVPASCAKLLTAVCALKQLGGEHTYENQLLANGTICDSVLYGCLLLQADDDPLVASFQPFAEALREAGISQIEGGILYRLTRSDTLRPHPSASPWDIPYRQVPLLMSGAKRIENEFRASLEACGVRYHWNPQFAHAWMQAECRTAEPRKYALAVREATHGARLIYSQPHTLLQVLAPMLICSDNAKAEAVLHRTGASLQDFACEVLPERADGLCALDGSGLSPLNRMSARFLTDLLSYAYADTCMWRVLMEDVLATPAAGGRTGTLYGRMSDPVLKGHIFCKTGTLASRGISSLAGYALGQNGCLYAFCILNDDTSVFEARDFQDCLCCALVLGH